MLQTFSTYLFYTYLRTRLLHFSSRCVGLGLEMKCIRTSNAPHLQFRWVISTCTTQGCFLLPLWFVNIVLVPCVSQTASHVRHRVYRCKRKKRDTEKKHRTQRKLSSAKDLKRGVRARTWKEKRRREPRDNSQETRLRTEHDPDLSWCNDCATSYCPKIAKSLCLASVVSFYLTCHFTLEARAKRD